MRLIFTRAAVVCLALLGTGLVVSAPATWSFVYEWFDPKSEALETGLIMSCAFAAVTQIVAGCVAIAPAAVSLIAEIWSDE